MSFDNVEDVLPLSPLQQGMLVHTLEAPASGVYIDQLTCTLDGELDVDLFRVAWQRLVARHGALRSAFLWDGLDEPLQVVRTQAELDWTVQDWRHRSAGSRQQEWHRGLSSDRLRGFELAEAPLVRHRLVRLGDRRWRWCWSFHHLILDGWSARLLLGELRKIYRALVAGDPIDLPPPTPFSAYLGWLAGQPTEPAEAWWRERLAGLDQPARLAAYPAAGSARPTGTRQLSSRLGKADSVALVELARAQRVTLSSAAAAAWGLTLGRYGHQSEALFGVTLAVRPAELPAIENAIGLYVNTLPLLLQLSPNDRLGDFLRKVQKAQLELQNWQHSSLAQVQAAAGIGTGEGLFDTLLVFENLPPAAPATGERGNPVDHDIWQVRQLEFVEQSNYPLAVLLVPGEELEIVMVYDSERWCEAAVEGVLEQFVGLLKALPSGGAETPLRELDGLDLEQHRQLAEQVSGEPLSCGSEAVERLIWAVAESRPQHPAVIAGETRLSYGELRNRSWRLAAELRRCGIGPEVPAAVFVERSPELIVALLAVLEAGGAWLPLEPSWPADHLRRLLEEARPPVVVCSAALAARLPASTARTVLVDKVEDSSPPPSEPVQTAGSGQVGGASLAYLMYTSGSSGQPKGVMVSRSNLLASTLARSQYYEAPVERFLLLSSFAFDSSVAGIFWTLTEGGSLVLPAPGEEQDLLALRGLLDRHRISHTLCLPTLWQLLLDDSANELDRLASLRAVIVAGEACSPALVEAHRQQLPSVGLYNEYGPTEMTVWSTVAELDQVRAGEVPIGRPIAGSRAELLDPYGRPVPVGMAGEMRLGGQGTARGYFGRPRLTAEHFRPTSAADEPGARVYGSGDLAYRRQDGELVFLGRADGQVKIRGYRIETDGVAAALLATSQVREAAVDLRPVPGTGDSERFRLVAWVVSDSTTLEPERLQQSLRQRLPAYMVPELIVPVDRLERLPNGKLDRRSLVVPSAEPAAHQAEPLNEIEALIAATWQELLEVDEVGGDDNFFALGGDSILAIQAVSRLRQAGLAVEPRQLPAHPTASRLAAAVERSGRLDGTSSESAGPIQGEAALLPMQSWFLDRGLEAPEHWNMAHLFEINSDLDRQRLAQALAALVEHHDQLRARFERRADGTWRQWIDPPREMPELLQEHQRTAGDAEAPRRWIERLLVDVQAGFDLAKGPLFGAALLDAGEGQPTFLLLTAHHLVVDAVSWALLLEDLATLYRQLGVGEAPSLPSRSTSARRWAAALAEHGQGLWRRQLDYWARDVEGAHQLPLDFELAPVDGGWSSERQARRVEIELDPATTKALSGAALEAYGSRVDELLITALALTVAEWRGRPTLRLDLEGHGRQALEKLDAARTVGWLTAAFPVLLRLGDEPPSTAIQTIKDQLRAVPGDGSGWSVLRYSLAEPRLSGLPEPNLLFNYLGRTRDRWQAPWRLLAESSPYRVLDSARHPDNARSHLLEINAEIRHGRLRAEWTYCADAWRVATIEGLAQRFQQRLIDLIDHCLSDQAGGLSASDFPDAGLDSDELANLFGQLS